MGKGFILISCRMSVASDLRVVLSPSALEEELAATRHEAEVACLWETLAVEDHERAVVVGIQQGAGVALAAMQLRIGRDLRRVAPGFPNHAGQVERVELVSDFAPTADAIVGAMNVEDIINGAGQGT